MGRLIIALALMLSLGLSVTGCKKEEAPVPDIGGVTDEMEDEGVPWAQEAVRDAEKAAEGSGAE